MLIPLAAAAWRLASPRPIAGVEAVLRVAATPAVADDVGPPVLDDRVEDVGLADLSVEALEIQDLGVRRNRPQDLDVERHLDSAVARLGDGLADRDALRGRSVDAVLLVEGGDVGDEVRVERHHGDRLALAEVAGLVHRDDVVGDGEVDRAHAAGRHGLGGLDHRPGAGRQWSRVQPRQAGHSVGDRGRERARVERRMERQTRLRIAVAREANTEDPGERSGRGLQAQGGPLVVAAEDRQTGGAGPGLEAGDPRERQPEAGAELGGGQEVAVVRRARVIEAGEVGVDRGLARHPERQGEVDRGRRIEGPEQARRTTGRP